MHTVGVIGLGNIAAMYGKPEDEFPYCHIGGILKSNRVHLVAVADMLEEKRESFKALWGEALPESVKWYDTAAAMLHDQQLDIVAVCVRGPHHHAVTMEVLQSNVKAIFLEKPPSCSLAEMDEMVAASATKNVPITVSYSRHWSPRVLRMQELVQEGLIGEVKAAVGYTGHSVLSFASHTTDLICQFAGYCPEAVFARGHLPEGDVPDGFEPEPQLESMVVEFRNGVTGIQIGANGEHSSFYCEVLGTEGMVRAGIYIPPYAQNEKREPIDLSQHNMPENASVFKVAYEQIADYLDGGPLPHCTNSNFVAVNEIGFAAIESVYTNQRIALPNPNRTRKVFANG
ncbi:MAG: hypothetical protein AUJ92_02910 [Armatimonadetes bacterium CG2_30_59_28]|nr:MAG: hypothetical protein AUJ92_02910 [Armatimonadetes bacterium CG2_30_59_28]